jgi:hypothetical protein
MIKHFNANALLFQQRNILVMNLKKRLLSLSNVIILAFLLATASNLQAQVGIASSSITPDASAMLEVRSSSKGFLGPRVSLTGTTDNTTISNTPVKGLLVYNLANVSDVTEGFYYFDGTSWVRIATGSNSSGQLLNVQVFTSGSGTYAPTSGTTRAEIILVGGGGGGGNAATTVSDKIGAMGGGGGSGTLLNAYIPISILNNNYSYSVGAGGGSFTDGGPTSLGGLIAPGGSKGEQMTTADNTTTTKLGGSGGTAATTISNANAVYYSILGTKGGDGVKM